jgi:acetyltransferase-like isoleucine patch superfamily enzyme
MGIASNTYFALRRLRYRLLLGAVGEEAKLEPGAEFTGRYKGISIGPRSRVATHACLMCNGGSIRIGAGCELNRHSLIASYGGRVSLGTGCSLNYFAILHGAGGISLGDNVRIGPHVVMVASNHVFEDPDLSIREQGMTAEGIFVEDDVWIGAGAIILDGVRIGRGAVVGAGAIVTKSIAPLTVAVGNPARAIAQRGAGRSP